MKLKPDITDVFWMAVGAAALLAVVLVVFHFRAGDDGSARTVRMSGLVERMRSDLASAAEAEKRAVMAVTDADSETFAEEARSETAAVERSRKDLEAELKSAGTREERASFAQFSEAFAEFQVIDRELLALAVKNTNLKAAALAFGPASTELEGMQAALTRVRSKDGAAPAALAVTRLSYAAETAALRIQALLAPHVAEASDLRMDELEARMSEDDRDVRRDLKELTELDDLGADPDLRAATDSYERFHELRLRILALSRENSNVRSLSISLHQKHKVMLLCACGALDALQRAIVAESNADAEQRVPTNPRRLAPDKRSTH